MKKEKNNKIIEIVKINILSLKKYSKFLRS